MRNRSGAQAAQAGLFARGIAEEMTLGLNTVRTIIDPAPGQRSHHLHCRGKRIAWSSKVDRWIKEAKGLGR
jgi:hypothetical protein